MVCWQNIAIFVAVFIAKTIWRERPIVNAALFSRDIAY